jgi:hypothetical protein
MRRSAVQVRALGAEGARRARRGMIGDQGKISIGWRLPYPAITA